MLTKLIIRNFKQFGEVEIELGDAVVFIGPNDSGKTTALQALALWDVGLKKWTEKRGGKETPKSRPGVTINRQELTALPIPNAKLIWRDLHVRNVYIEEGKQRTKNINIEIIVSGISAGKSWECGLEFDYANEESFYCRPLRVGEGKNPKRMKIPEGAQGVTLAFLPPMSGLADREHEKQRGEVQFLIGQGRTAEVLRNLCHQLKKGEDGDNKWESITERIWSLFGIRLEIPIFIPERSEILMSYKNRDGVSLDISSSGRGLQQTLLLLVFIATNPGAVLLLDEPDAHLEILRQRQTYQMLTEMAEDSKNQIIAASHSEVVLNEAADKDMVVAFVGKPHRIDDRGFQVLKSLKFIGFDQYYLAEQTGWVLYVEGSTDLAILKAFAGTLKHPAAKQLERAFIVSIGNQPKKARDQFFGLLEAKPDLVGFLLTDNIDPPTQQHEALIEYKWKRREIENYLCQSETLIAFAREFGKDFAAGQLFEKSEIQTSEKVMKECIEDLLPPKAFRDSSDEYWLSMKASDDYLDRVFPEFFSKLNLQNLMNKSDYHKLAKFVKQEQIDPEINGVLDMINNVAGRAKPIM